MTWGSVMAERRPLDRSDLEVLADEAEYLTLPGVVNARLRALIAGRSDMPLTPGYHTVTPFARPVVAHWLLPEALRAVSRAMDPLERAATLPFDPLELRDPSVEAFRYEPQEIASGRGAAARFAWLAALLNSWTGVAAVAAAYESRDLVVHNMIACGREDIAVESAQVDSAKYLGVPGPYFDDCPPQVIQFAALEVGPDELDDDDPAPATEPTEGAGEFFDSADDMINAVSTKKVAPPRDDGTGQVQAKCCFTPRGGRELERVITKHRNLETAIRKKFTQFQLDASVASSEHAIAKGRVHSLNKPGTAKSFTWSFKKPDGRALWDWTEPLAGGGARAVEWQRFGGHNIYKNKK